MVEDSHPAVLGLFGRWLGNQSVPIEGFRWVGDEYEVHEPEERSLGYTTATWGPWLVPASGESVPKVRPVDVLNDPRRSGFHRTFASLADGQEARRWDKVLRFANHYGHLDSENLFWLVRTRSGLSPISIEGEAWRAWELAIFHAATVVHLWDMVKWKDRSLASLVRYWNPPEATIECIYRNRRLYAEFPERGPLAGNDGWRGGAGFIHQPIRLDPQTSIAQLPADEDRASSGFLRLAVEAARLVIYQEVERHLSRKVAPVISNEGSPDFWHIPLTLHAAVYLHLAREITGRTRGLIQCENPRCARHFEPAHGAQKYCEASCRKQADHYRHFVARREAARERRARGTVS